MFLDSDFMTNIKPLHRVSHRRVFIFMANGNGVLGYGKGLGINYKDAFQNAIINAKKNLIIIDLDPANTCPNKKRVRFNDVRLRVNPRRVGDYWGSMFMWMMFQLTGFCHCSFTIIARKPSPYALVYAFFMASIQNSTTRKMSEVTGNKPYNFHVLKPTFSQTMPML